MIRLDAVEAHWTPYPYALAREVFDPGIYMELVRSWPPIQAFKQLHSGYHKWSLSEVNYPKTYHEYLHAVPVWRAVHAAVKHSLFAASVLETLAKCGITVPEAGPFHTRFEFSALPAAGGKIDPHRDVPGKVVTLVIPVYAEGEWDHNWGGGTDLLSPVKNPATFTIGKYGTADYMVPRSDFRVDAIAPYVPNQALLFVRSETSWHSVGPFTGPEKGPWRKTLTINIERYKA